jgi:hypothetical protein
MARIRACELPETALLGRYRKDGAYVDCYCVELDRAVAQAEYVEAFYTTAVFKLERWLLARFLKRPSTDAQARVLALGPLEAFAAWTVEARAPDQLLLCDMFGRTCSWLMSIPSADGRSTRLCFGSAVVPVRDRRSGRSRPGFWYEALTPLHRFYSRVLLGAAAGRLLRKS